MPGCALCNSSNPFLLPCRGTTTRIPLSVQPLSTLSSVRILKYGRRSLSCGGTFHPFSYKFLTLAKTGSCAVHFLIMHSANEAKIRVRILSVYIRIGTQYG